MKVGFIGLGNMGRAMARNLIKAGHEVTVYNRTRSRAEEMAAEGAAVASSVAEACVTGVVMTMLADDSAIEETTFGKARILDALPEGGVHVSCSTISIDLTRRLVE
jgi:3-hydroxyisobutyrate dehydrogenase-like beta-hydroxyacid dehydrogenase